MIGTNSEKDFSLENYDDFYAHHRFQPVSERDAFRINEHIPRFGWAFDTVEELKPKNLLDLGCLDGSFCLTISKQLGIQTHGVDLTIDGIELARKRAEQNELNATFEQGTIEKVLREIAAFGNKYDMVTMFEVIEHVEDVQEVLRLIDQVLAPGGSVLVSTPAAESPAFGLDDEKNKCHIRLYTMEDKNYKKVNKYGTLREATSITKEIGKDRIKEMGLYSELINVRYQ